MITFQEDSIASVIGQCYNNIITDHWDEVSMYKDKVELNLDTERYLRLQELGHLHVVTAKDDDKIIGYFISFISPHIHYRDTVFAMNDAIYVAPEYRKGTTGIKLIRSAEKFLRKRGVEVITIHVKPTRDFSPVLKRCGFDEFETVYSKYVGEG